MSLDVSHLTEDCLLHIFSFIPLSDLIHSVAWVCPSWAEIHRAELRRRRTLVLLKNRFHCTSLFANSENIYHDYSGTEEEEQSDNEDDSDSGSEDTEDQSDSKSVSEQSDHQNDSNSMSEQSDHQNDSNSMSEQSDHQNDSNSMSEQSDHQNDSNSVSEQSDHQNDSNSEPEEIKVQQDNSNCEPNPTLNEDEIGALKLKEKLIKLQANENPYGSGLISHVRREDGELHWIPVRSLDQIKFNVIEYGCGHSKRETSRLIRYFPNLTHLTLEQNGFLKDDRLTQLIRLIRHYSNSLISRHLELDYESKNPDEAFESDVLALFESINRLPSLQHLTLNVTFKDMNIEPRLTILPRLTTFISNRFRPERPLVASLRQLMDADDGGRVRLNCRIRDLTWAQLSELDPRLLAKFDRLNVGTRKLDDGLLRVEHFDSLNLLCSRLTNLSALKLATHLMPMTMLARCLSQLTGLIHLKVRFDPKFIMIRRTTIPKEEQTKPPREIVQLPSVRLLSLNFSTYSHHDTERLKVAEIFPNLQVLRLEHHPSACPTCGYHNITWNNRNIHSRSMQLQVAYCMHLARLPFSRCANLHTIKLDTDEAFERMIRLDLLTLDLYT